MTDLTASLENYIDYVITESKKTFGEDFDFLKENKFYLGNESNFLIEQGIVEVTIFIDNKPINTGHMVICRHLENGKTYLQSRTKYGFVPLTPTLALVKGTRIVINLTKEINHV